MTELSQIRIEDQIKEIAKKAGADLVGITSKDRLMDNKCSDPTYLLPAAESVIGFAISLDKKIVRDFLQKKDISAQKKMSLEEGKLYHRLEDIGNAIKEFLESKGYEAVNCEVNMDYRKYKRRGKGQLKQLKQLIELAQKNPDHPLVQGLKKGGFKLIDLDLTPQISHRYVGVACGIGRLGWSGNLMTPEYGTRIYLGSVITNAKLKSDPYLEENPCTRCKVCVSMCQGQFFDPKETQIVKIGEIEEVIAKRHTLAKCILSCGAFTGRSKFKDWSTWSPWRIDIPEDDNEADKKVQQTFIEYILTGGEKAANVLRLATDTQLGFLKSVKPVEDFQVTCGFCQLVCWESEEERHENARIVRSSGVVELDDKGNRIIKTISK